MKIAVINTLAVIMIAITFMACTQKDITNVTWMDNQPPSVTLLLPAPGDTLRGLVDIQVQATDDNVVSWVEFYLDGALADSQDTAEDSLYLYSWDTETYPDGPHLIFVRAYDEAQNYGDAVPILAQVDNINENASRTLRVPSEYLSIQQGVNAARDGDTVLVEPGIYHETFNYKGKGIWVKSEAGPAETIWEGLLQNRFTIFNNGEDSSSVVCGFKIIAGFTGITIDYNCSPKVINCIIISMDYSGILTHASNSRLLNNTIYNCENGVQASGICLIENNIVVSGTGYGFWNAQLYPQYAPIGDYNCVWDWGIANYNERWNVGTYDLSADPLFQDTLFFRLQPDSPCIDTGDPDLLDPDGSRSDMGAWGGPHAYD